MSVVPTANERLAATPRKQNPPVSRVVTGGVPMQVSHTIAGTIGELLAAADLMARGYAVFLAVSRTACCDLVAVSNSGRAITIEVRCGHRSGDRVVFSKKDSSKADHYAIIITGEPVVYQPDLSWP